MLKVILIATSFANDSFDSARVGDFHNGKFIAPVEYTAHSNFWIECTLPAVPLINSPINLGAIEAEEMIAQLKEVYTKVEGFRNLVRKFRDANIDYLGDITIENALLYFCGYENKVDNVYSGHWYVDRVCFRANDEYVYVEMHHEL